MRIRNQFNIVILTVIVATLLGCQQEDSFDIPTEIGNEENAALNALLTELENGDKTLISIAQAKDYFVRRRVHTVASELVLKGYVVSTDRTGNFYNEIYIQDTPKDPTAAIHVMIEKSDSHNTFNLGREVYIDIKGLHVGESRVGNGIISIGGSINSDGDEVESIRRLAIAKHIFRSKTTAEIAPRTVQFSKIDHTHIGMYVAIEKVRVLAKEQGLPFVDPYDWYDTQRTLESCVDADSSFLLETSTFASYKDLPLPSGSGSIRGIVSKTYNGSDFVLTLNDATDMMFTETPCGG